MTTDTPQDTGSDERNFDFVMIDYEVLDSYNLKAFTLALYVAIVRYAGFRSSKAFPSIKTLAEAAGMSAGAVDTHLEKLVEAGLISITARTRDNGSDTTILVLLNPTPRLNYTLLEDSLCYDDGFTIITDSAVYATHQLYFTLGVGCTGGRHRSVALAEAVSAALVRGGRSPAVTHRDLSRSPLPRRSPA